MLSPGQIGVVADTSPASARQATHKHSNVPEKACSQGDPVL